MLLKITTNEFINKANEIHKNKYIYSNVEYINSKTKICIICLIHGEFWQVPSKHLMGQGCPKCSGRYKTTEEFIKEACYVHNNKYNYSKVCYVKAKEKVCIICPEHGEFWQTPLDHLNNHGCAKCYLNIINKDKLLNTEEFIKKSISVHGDKYDYSNTNYTKSKNKICIICPIHGEFWQKPNDHLNKRVGCQKCHQSILEKDIENFLIKHRILYVSQKKFKWLKHIGYMSLDFFLPDYNIGIECQGIQHFEPTDFAGKGMKWAQNTFNKLKIRDKTKQELCSQNNINLIYYSNKNNECINTIQELFEYLNNIIKII